MRRRWVVIREGTEHDTANDLAVLEDEQLAKDVARLIARRLGVTIPGARPSVIPLSRRDSESDG
jgi:hypothetical protein